MSYLLKRCFPLQLGEGFKVAGCLSCPLPAAGRSPEVLPSRSLSAVPGLAPVGPVSSQSFPSYCFPGSLRLQQLFTSLGLPFSGEVCPSHQLPSSAPPAIQVLALSLHKSSCNRLSSPAAFPPHPARRMLTLPLQLTHHPLNTAVSLPV